MKIVNLMGGLGNQMFQYAFGLALAMRNKEQVLYDTTWFKNFSSTAVSQRKYELGHFKAEINIANEQDRIQCISQKTIKEDLEKGPDYHINYNGDAYYIGYFQNEDYFKDMRENILQDFTLKTPLNQVNQEALTQIKEYNSISLHVRRGDYVNLNLAMSDMSYYDRAIEYMAQRVDNPVFFVFSDDIDWVCDNLNIQYPTGVVDINDSSQGVFDLELMKNCKHNIVANSSFSWWGAWLNTNPEKIVIAPPIWGPDIKGIGCKEWVKL